MMASLTFSLVLLLLAGGFDAFPNRIVVNGFDVTHQNKISTELTYTSSISSSPSSPSSPSTDLGMISVTTGSEYDIDNSFSAFISDSDTDDDKSTFYDESITSSSSTAYMGPPVGAIYESRLRFPVLGTQSFSLQIQSKTQAHLKVDGKLKFNEPVQYSFDQNDGKLNFALSEQLKLKLRRYFTSLQEVGYDPITDTPYVKVLPPLPTAIKIFLKRVHH